ncbi:MAG TPA: alpha/beta hydrolase [Rhizomicrobium sp.]
MGHWLRGMLVGLAALVLAVVAIGMGYRAWRQRENGLAMAMAAPNGIEQTGFVAIGGIDQWISIRGRDRANPVILLLHGGPGLAMSPLQLWFVPWERDFTVVQWDQRGAGLTYGRYGKATPDLSEEQIVQDGIELAEYLCRRLHKKKIVLLGHSWGSQIGLQMIRRRPDLFSAYVGTGQAVDNAEAERRGYERLLRMAQSGGDARTVAALKQLGPAPYADADAMMSERRLAAAYAPPGERDYLMKSTPTALFAPGISLMDLYDNVSGALYSGSRLFAEASAFKAERLGTSFATPVFFFQGDLDDIAPADLVAAYFAKIEAPQKALVRFRGGGHLTLLTMREEFLRQLDVRVRPLAAGRDGVPTH